MSVLSEVEGEVSVMESDIDISSDEDDHDDRGNGVLLNCDEEDYGKWSVGEGNDARKGGLDYSLM